MATETVTCDCGAVYERGEAKLPVRDKDSYPCGVCGAILEEWNGSRIPTFTLIKRPDDR